MYKICIRLLFEYYWTFHIYKIQNILSKHIFNNSYAYLKFLWFCEYQFLFYNCIDILFDFRDKHNDSFQIPYEIMK